MLFCIPCTVHVVKLSASNSITAYSNTAYSNTAYSIILLIVNNG